MEFLVLEYFLDDVVVVDEFIFNVKLRNGWLVGEFFDVVV